MTNRRDKVRAVFLSAIMIISMVGMSAALAGTAAAQSVDDGDVSPDIIQSDDTTTVEANLTDLNDGDDEDYNLTIDIAEGASIDSGEDLSFVQEEQISGGTIHEEDGFVNVSFESTDNTDVDLSLNVTASAGEDGEYDVTGALDEGDDGTIDDVLSNLETLTIDDTAPIVSIDSPDDDSLQQSVGEINGTLDEENPDTVELTITNDSGDSWDGSEFTDSETTVSADVSGDGDDWDYTDTPTEDGTYDVFATATDEAGNENTSDTISYEIDDTAPDTNVIQIGDEEENIQQSGDDLKIIYENIDENTESATITLERINKGGDDDFSDETYTYEIDDSANIDDSQKAIKLDLINQIDSSSPELDDGNLYDGSYEITIETEDAAGNTGEDSTDSQPLVINDDVPAVTIEEIEDDVPQNVGPSETIDITYTYEDATNASSVDVDLFDSDDGPFDPVDDYVATVELDVDHDADGEQTQEVDLSSAVNTTPDHPVDVDLEDNQIYDVQLSVTNTEGQSNSPPSESGDDFALDGLVVNEDAPSIDDVQADAGVDHITVTFSEGVQSQVGEDANLDRTAFTYQNASGTGASSIESVDHTAGEDEAILHLDAPVDADDLETDGVSVREDEVSDMIDKYEKYVDSGDTVLLEDNEAPSASIDAADISQDNEEDYDVTVFTQKTDEIVEVDLTIVDDDGEEITATEDDVQNSVTFSELDVSSLDDGDVTIEVEVTDAGSNTFSTDTEVTKDTVSPEIQSVETNAGTDQIVVTFDKDVEASVGDFDLQGAGADVEDVIDNGDNVTVFLDGGVSFDAINNSDTANISATGVTDTVAGADGNPAVDDPVALDDTEPPFIAGTEAQINSDEVMVEFSELVVNESGDSLDADDFTYENDSDAAPTEIVSVDHDAESATAILTLDAAVTADALENDSISIAENVVFDADDNTAAGQTIGVNDGIPPVIDVNTDVDDSTITYTIESSEELESIEHTISPVNILEQTQVRPEAEAPGAELTIDDFEFDDSGSAYNYTASFDAPRDGQYVYDLEVTDFGGNLAFDRSSSFQSDDVDTDDASVDASFLNPDDFESLVWVFFDEPVDVTDVDTEDVTIDGENVDSIVDNSSSAGEAGYIIVESDNLQTGDEPDVEVAGDSFNQLANDSSAGQTSSATVDTAWYTVDEGTNFLSVPALSGGQSLDDLDTSSVDAIWTYDQGEWMTYDPDASDNDFDTLEGGQGYIVEASGADTLEINVFNQEASSTGEVEGSLLNQQQLEEGWNLVGHYQTFAQESPDALSTIDDEIHLVYGQESGLDYELVDNDEDLTPGEAYWTFVTDDTVYTFTPN